MGLEDHRQRLVSSGYQWGDRPGEVIANDDLDDSRAPPNPNLERGAAAFDALCDHMNSRHPPAASISLKAPTTVGWSLEKLVSRSENFHHIRRVSATSTDLHTHIANYERDGIPLVIEGWHKHQYWPANLFDVDWFIRYGSQRMSVRNIHNWRDSTISLSEFIQKSRSSPPFIVQDETERLYGKDAECPEQWNKWLREGGAIPSSLLSGGPEDYLRNLPKLNRVETLMCYLGIGDTFTPCHKDLCASSGQNLMCYTENDGCSFWFMTESSSALDVSKYFHSLNQELDHETHVITIDELAKAPFTVYIAQQKLGDLVLVPPRSSHQVVIMVDLLSKHLGQE
ncbi:hypothetical protein BD779DRAFT_1190079 [Infundibulicybe gibba]|nr:hypothetical protein BD779DRAFT_1190079 [Infundibulicybe gibba]